jgi:NitT/TauT family transport system substrate-binding protein
MVARTVLMLFALLLVLPGMAAAREKITVAYLDEDSHRAVFYAIEEGIIKSDLIDVETRALNIPALLQATGAKQFDIVQTAVVAVPKLAERGVQLRILSVALAARDQATAIFVKNDSPLKAPADLKGRGLAVEALGATVTTYMRVALQKKYGLSMALQGGDVRLEQIPRDVIPGLLSQGKIDAAYLYHTPAYKLRRDPNFRILQNTIKDFVETVGVRPVTALMVTYPETLRKKAAAIKEFNRMLLASMEYARTRPQVWEAVARKHNTTAEFLKDWFAHQYDFPATINVDLARGVQKMWELTQELGDLKTVPKVDDFVWWDGVAR